ncbi:MAG: prepilin peptidase [Acidimicrobiaceae bacterium]|nr:prepilin peptidase [Acidimicrobiaceae bacterium]
MSVVGALVVAAGAVWLGAAVRLSVIDLRTRTLPTRIIWSTAAVVWGIYCAASLAVSEPDALIGAALGALAGSAPLAAIHLVHPPSMGAGDVRFSALNGLVCGWWGWQTALIGLALAFCAALPEAVVAMARRGRNASRPLGPYLALGTVAAWVWGAATSGLAPGAL